MSANGVGCCARSARGLGNLSRPEEAMSQLLLTRRATTSLRFPTSVKLGADTRLWALRTSRRFFVRCNVAAPQKAVEAYMEPERRDTLGTLNMGQYKALVLDSSYRPIDVVNWQRALCMGLFDKVDVLEYYDGILVRSAYDEFLLPAVIRVRCFIQKGMLATSVTINRRNLFLRDHHTCQYCGSKSNLTIDHVTPICRGGTWSWNNLVTACSTCNGIKGSKTLKQLGWKLHKQPTEPSVFDYTFSLGFSLSDINSPPKEWGEYLFPMSKSQRASKAD